MYGTYLVPDLHEAVWTCMSVLSFKNTIEEMQPHRDMPRLSLVM